MDSLTWHILTIIGTIAFAASGAIVAIKERYDILGVFVLGFVTAFGGGIIRNILIGTPVSQVWSNLPALYSALVVSLIAFLLPKVWFTFPKTWIILDAIGLIAFSIQGSLMAKNADLPVLAVVFASLLTGTGGGVIRDVLARRRPLLFRDEIYGGWSIVCAIIIYYMSSPSVIFLYILLFGLVCLRLISYRYRWSLPKRNVRFTDKKL